MADKREVFELQRGFEGAGAFFVVGASCRGDAVEGEGVEAEEDGERFRVDLRAGSKNGGVEGVGGGAAGEGAFDGEGRDEEVSVDLLADLRGEDG